MDLKFKRKIKHLSFWLQEKLTIILLRNYAAKQKVPWSKWEEEILSSGFRR